MMISFHFFPIKTIFIHDFTSFLFFIQQKKKTYFMITKKRKKMDGKLEN